MIDIKEKIESKPSKALEFMVNGLIKHDKRNDFKVDMSTFGHYNIDDQMCYGCAATCAIQEITGMNLTKKTIDTNNFYKNDSVSVKQKEYFENAINNARVGLLDTLFEFCKKKRYYKEEYDWMCIITTDNWKQELPKVKKLIKELKSKGL